MKKSMYFEIYGAKNQVVETDNLRDIEKISCVGCKIVYNGLTLAEYSAVARAEEVIAQLKDTFKSGEFDFYKLPKE